MSLWNKHAIFEKNSIILILGVIVMISFGGLVEIAPLFYLKSTIEQVKGVRPYTPLELAGRHIYIREGCYNCHSQMIRPLRDEVERYGHYSLAAESMFDKPFQWGSKRTGPDLARVGAKYSDDWQFRHLVNPRDVVPQSIMPGYPFLAKADLDADDIGQQMKVQTYSGIPYTEDMIANAAKDLKAQVNPDDPNAAALEKRYGKVNVRKFDGGANPAKITEADALIAYLQVLGTMVDFKGYDAKANFR